MEQRADALPEWYPFADATKATIDQWLTSKSPPYAEMKEALPWLHRNEELACCFEGVRQALPIDTAGMRDVFPGLMRVPLPPNQLGDQA